MVSTISVLAQAALAATVSGSANAVVSQGQFCDISIGIHCTHARLPKSGNGAYQPVREAVVYIEDSNGTAVANTETDLSGNCSCESWTGQHGAAIGRDEREIQR